MVKVLIVDDSATAQKYLEYIISSDKDLRVVGVAKDGEEATILTRLKRPDVVLMDIHMPKMNGYEATRKIMQAHPVPIVIISALLALDEGQNIFQAMQAGAVAVLEKPKGLGHTENDRMVAKLIQTVKLMSEVRVVRRISRFHEPKAVHERLLTKADIKPVLSKEIKKEIKVVLIGASTGGPPVIETILSRLVADFPYPVLIVQHIAEGFLEGMVEWLGRKTALRVQIPADGEYVMGGHVYFAPDSCNMGITRSSKIALDKTSPAKGPRPSVSYLFDSATKAFGKGAVGVLLTGMGKDGALELKMMRDKKAITIAQDKESSLVHGMAGEAIKMGAAAHILSPEKIVAFLNSLAGSEMPPLFVRSHAGALE